MNLRIQRTNTRKTNTQTTRMQQTQLDSRMTSFILGTNISVTVHLEVKGVKTYDYSRWRRLVVRPVCVFNRAGGLRLAGNDVRTRIKPNWVESFTDDLRRIARQRETARNDSAVFRHLTDEFLAQQRHHRVDAEDDDMVVDAEFVLEEVSDRERGGARSAAEAKTERLQSRIEHQPRVQLHTMCLSGRNWSLSQVKNGKQKNRCHRVLNKCGHNTVKSAPTKDASFEHIKGLC